MNAAARVVSGTKKYHRGLTHLLNSELNWLDVAERVIQASGDGVQVLAWPGTGLSV